MTILGAHVGSFGVAEPARAEPRELVALGRASEWLNSPRLTPASLAGKVVLVDFWTYTCINWLRTLPYVRAWAARYKEHGLVVLGVHTPEFSFEEDIDNVRRSVETMGIEYPIASKSPPTATGMISDTFRHGHGVSSASSPTT